MKNHLMPIDYISKEIYFISNEGLDINDYN